MIDPQTISEGGRHDFTVIAVFIFGIVVYSLVNGMIQKFVFGKSQGTAKVDLDMFNRFLEAFERFSLAQQKMADNLEKIEENTAINGKLLKTHIEAADDAVETLDDIDEKIDKLIRRSGADLH